MQTSKDKEPCLVGRGANSPFLSHVGFREGVAQPPPPSPPRKKRPYLLTMSFMSHKLYAHTFQIGMQRQEFSLCRNTEFLQLLKNQMFLKNQQITRISQLLERSDMFFLFQDRYEVSPRGLGFLRWMRKKTSAKNMQIKPTVK